MEIRERQRRNDRKRERMRRKRRRGRRNMLGRDKRQRESEKRA